jgi:hypothetical protein
MWRVSYVTCTLCDVHSRWRTFNVTYIQCDVSSTVRYTFNLACILCDVYSPCDTKWFYTNHFDIRRLDIRRVGSDRRPPSSTLKVTISSKDVHMCPVWRVFYKTWFQCDVQFMLRTFNETDIQCDVHQMWRTFNVMYIQCVVHAMWLTSNVTCTKYHVHFMWRTLNVTYM